jgi:hypothetical protein
VAVVGLIKRTHITFSFSGTTEGSFDIEEIQMYPICDSFAVEPTQANARFELEKATICDNVVTWDLKGTPKTLTNGKSTFYRANLLKRGNIKPFKNAKPFKAAITLEVDIYDTQSSSLFKERFRGLCCLLQP